MNHFSTMQFFLFPRPYRLARVPVTNHLGWHIMKDAGARPYYCIVTNGYPRSNEYIRTNPYPFANHYRINGGFKMRIFVVMPGSAQKTFLRNDALAADFYSADGI